MNIGEAIRTIRLSLALTQEQVSTNAQLTQGFYSAIENGGSYPSIEALERISNTFGVPSFAILWMATDRKKIHNKVRTWFDFLQPTMNALIQEAITQKTK